MASLVKLSGVLATTNAAPLTCTGGAASAGTGGPGGQIALLSVFSSSTSASAPTAIGGAGLTAGAAGSVMLDGILQ